MTNRAPIRPVLSWLLGIAVFVVTGIVSISCARVLAIDGRADAVKSLCDEYNACFGNNYPRCEELAGERLANASVEARTAWLAKFSVSGCLDICGETRDCMDEPPFCGELLDPCDVLDSCCSGTQCQDGRCCNTGGSTCTDGRDCCSGFCINGTCNGIECVDEGQTCSSTTECCDTLRCGASTGTCFRCKPELALCMNDEECCGRCTLGQCEDICQQDFSDCDADEDCCSEKCSASGDGVPTCCPVPLGDRCSHRPCDTGAALDPSCDPAGSSCHAQVCIVLPACCCNAWVDECVALYQDFCGPDCL